jgi:hypothetical protein
MARPKKRKLIMIWEDDGVDVKVDLSTEDIDAKVRDDVIIAEAMSELEYLKKEGRSYPTNIHLTTRRDPNEGPVEEPGLGGGE